MEGLRGELFPAMIFANEHFSATIHTHARERLAVPTFLYLLLLGRDDSYI
jgi:hypothetical protein